MAIDTAKKRFSIMGLANPTLKLVIPDGSGVDQGDKQTFLDMYSGIAFNTATGYANKVIGVTSAAMSRIVNGSASADIDKVIGA